MRLDAVRTYDGCGVTATYAEGAWEALGRRPKWRANTFGKGAEKRLEKALEIELKECS